ncbi:hypothetical protein V492_01750 [Pseudogymnoascus sp. VKM F-4246]|nr:hypothetical protein V492_01750 [Pseudogymnoascus sp. VKM F-4246]
MLNVIEKAQNHAGMDLTTLSGTTTQVATVELNEKPLLEATQTQPRTVEVDEKALLQAAQTQLQTVEVDEKALLEAAQTQPQTVQVNEKPLLEAAQTQPQTVEVNEKPLLEAVQTQPQTVEVDEKALLEAAQTQPRTTPKLESPYLDDVAFARLVDLHLPPEVKKSAEVELARLGDAAVSQQLMGWVADAESSPPHIQHWDSWGEEKDGLVTSQGWKNLWRFGISERLAALPSLNKEYEGHARMIQLLKVHLFAPASATTSFHLILSDGVASLLLAHLHDSKIDEATRSLFQHAYERLTSTDPNEGWTSGLWMTERAGGSDLTPTETTATFSPLGPDDNSKDADGFPLGPWVLDGLKWFSTSTEGSMAVAVARTASGLSAFYVPMRRAVKVNGVTQVELNGVRIRRLKNKMGTKSLPTGELELKGMRGWLIGTEGKGIGEIGVVLNITRIHLAMASVGLAARGLSVARSFARVRKVSRGTRLSSVPLHMKTLAKAHVTYRAHLAMCSFVAALLGRTEQLQAASPPQLLDLVPKSAQDVSCLLRLLGSVAKATSTMDCVGVLQTGMESLGGVGYVENDDMAFNVARLFRDCSAILIGEGTTDVIGTDVVKILKGSIGPYVVKAYGRWVESSLPKKESMAPEATIISQQWSELETAISSNTMEHLTRNAREIMQRVAKLTSGILLLADAARDDNAVAMEVARRWIQPATLLEGLSAEQGLMLDQQIVFGDQPTWLGVL